jgi:hypothetical protein
VWLRSVSCRAWRTRRQTEDVRRWTQWRPSTAARARACFNAISERAFPGTTPAFRRPPQEAFSCTSGRPTTTTRSRSRPSSLRRVTSAISVSSCTRRTRRSECDARYPQRRRESPASSREDRGRVRLPGAPRGWGRERRRARPRRCGARARGLAPQASTEGLWATSNLADATTRCPSPGPHPQVVRPVPAPICCGSARFARAVR